MVSGVETSGRQLFTEHNGSFVPVIETNRVYEVSVSGPVEREVCELRSESQLVQVELRSGSSAGCHEFCVDRPCVTGFYRLRCLDIETLVYVEGQEPAKEWDLSISESWLPDGQGFRRLIGSLEENVGVVQKGVNWKLFLENLTRLNDLLVSVGSVCGSLQSFQISLSNSQNHPLQRLFNEQFQTWIKSLKTDTLGRAQQSLNRDLIAPLQEFVESEKQNQKTFAKKQKNFSEAVKLMYSLQSTSPLTAKINYDLARLDYQDYLLQSYIIGSPLQRLYESVSRLFNCPTSETITRIDERYRKRVKQTKLAIKRAKCLEDLFRTYTSIGVPHKENYLLVRNGTNDHESFTNNASSSNGSSVGGSHWLKRWVELDGPLLLIFGSSKKMPFQLIDLSFACIKYTNKTIIEIITSGSASQTSLLMSVNSSSSSDYDGASALTRVYLQLKDEPEAKSWLAALQQSNMDTKQSVDSSSNVKSHDSLIDLVKRQHESNLRCCDCGSSETVEWISISLLCILCIQCSGVHRSMGSHISKVRSLTLDNFTSPEILHLLQNNVSNANVNSIYESKGTIVRKIHPNSPDNERSQYIIDKYQAKKMVDDGGQDGRTSLRSLIKAIHLNSVYFLQKAIAQSKLSVRDVVKEQARDQEIPTIFQYSLKHHEMVNEKPVFFITEFLLYNGLPVDKVPDDTATWSPYVINYWKSKVEIYGTNVIVSSHPKSTVNRETQLSSLVIPQEKSSNRRWTLNHMPSSPQIKSPTNLLGMHKSLKLSKKGTGKKE